VALLYKAQLVPTKIDLLRGWLPTQPWWTGDVTSLVAVGAYRFDDPADEVGIETHLVRAGDGPVMHVPLTYRGAPLEGADDALITPMQHSVLGQRWVYDACFDPVYSNALATAILTGGTEAELQVMTDNGLQRLDPTARVTGSGTPDAEVPPIGPAKVRTDRTSSTIRTAELELVVRRVLDSDVTLDGAPTLAGIWPGNDEPVVLALARPL
jgi:Maltokinase N-terminal cap domain